MPPGTDVRGSLADVKWGNKIDCEHVPAGLWHCANSNRKRQEFGIKEHPLLSVPRCLMQV